MATAKTTSQGPPPTPAIPAATLRQALLTSSDLGTGWQSQPTSGSGSAGFTNVKNCAALVGSLNGNATNTPGSTQAEADYQISGASDGSAAAFGESLTSDPASAFKADLAAANKELRDCQSFAIPAGAQKLNIELTPINFGPGLTRRLDSTNTIVPVNGYLNVSPIGAHTALVVFFFQIGSGSSQAASGYVQQAVAKAQAELDH